MRIKHILKAFAVFAITSTTVFADPICKAGMLRGAYAFQGSGSKLDGTVKSAVVLGTVNFKAAGVDLVVSQTTFGSATTVTDKWVGTYTVGSTAPMNVNAESAINCRGRVTLTRKNGVDQTSANQVILRLQIYDGGNGFYLYNASTTELWSGSGTKS